MRQGRGSVHRAKVLSTILGVTSFLTMLSLLRPVDIYHPSASGSTPSPNSFAYLPFAAHAQPTPTPASPGIDLIIWDIIIEPPVPVVGQTFVITVTARNQGAANAGQGTYVRLKVGVLPPLDKLVAPLAAGAAVDVEWALSFSSAGQYTARGEIDPWNTIVESREDNNVLQQSFVVLSSSR